MSASAMNESLDLAEAVRLFDDELRAAAAEGPDALAQFMSDSHADGKAGATKFKAVPSADGKSWQMHRVGPDGALAPMGPRFPGDEMGMATSAFMLSRGVLETDKLAHLLARGAVGNVATGAGP